MRDTREFEKEKYIASTNIYSALRKAMFEVYDKYEDDRELWDSTIDDYFEGILEDLKTDWEYKHGNC